MDISAVAKLANLTLSEKEQKNLETQLEETIKYIDIISELDTSKVPPTSQVTGLTNVTRDDKIDTYRIVSPPPEKYYIVPAIFTNDA